MTAPRPPSLKAFQQSLAMRLLGRDEDAADLDLDAAGLAVHAHNVSASLRTAIETAFPVVRQLVGDAFFAALAERFVRERPPHRGWLSAYGAEFPDHVAAYPPAAGLIYLADVARIEWARVHAANAQDTPGLDLQTLATTPPDQLEGLRLNLHPAASLIRSAFPVFDIWRAHQGSDSEDRLGDIDLAASQGVLITRSGPKAVSVVALEAGDAALLAAVAERATFGRACQAAADMAGDYDLAAALMRLAELRALARAIA